MVINFLYQFGFLGIQELGIVFIIILVLFGGKNLPSLAKNVGKTVREVKSSFENETEDSSKETSEPSKQKPEDEPNSKSSQE